MKNKKVIIWDEGDYGKTVFSEPIEEDLSSETLVQEDHFEFISGQPGSTPDRFGSDNHADIFDIGAQNVPAFGAARTIAQSAGKLFGIGKEDKSDKGYQIFLQGFAGLPFYPTKEEVIAAAQEGKWDRAEPAAIQNSYNPTSGQWTRGDWKFQVTGTSPIKAVMFKGAKERFNLNSTINAKIPVNQSPSNAPVAVAQSTSPSPSLSPAQQQVIAQLLARTTPDKAHEALAQSTSPSPSLSPSPFLSPAQQQVIAQLPAGTTPDKAHEALANNGVALDKSKNPFTGDASVSGMGSGLFGNMSQGMTIGLILGFLALVAVIIWAANK
jgi:hypothetical protein